MLQKSAYFFVTLHEKSVKMRKLFIFVFLFPLIACAQDVDTAKYSVWYEVTYKRKTVGDPLFKEREILEIGDKYSFYYSYQRQLFVNFLDSIERANPGVEDKTGFYLDKNCPAIGNTYMVLKNMQNDSLAFMEKINQGQWFRYVEAFPVNDWKLVEGDTTILSMPCNKAILDLHGRHWMVWYTTEVPIPDGPWKFEGLPGLIMKASESGGIFSFTCIGITECNKPIRIEKRNYVNTTPKKYEEELKDYWHNQMEYIFRVNNLPNTSGMWKDEKSYTPCLIEFY